MQQKPSGILKEYTPILLTYQVKQKKTQDKILNFASLSYATKLRRTFCCMTGVRFPGLTHPGIIGTAPSMELLNIWNERERELEETGLQTLKLCEVLHSRPLANLPSPKGCLLGKV